MSRVKSKWTAPEVLVHNQLKGLKIKHKMHPKMMGNPDVLIKVAKKVVFVQGCFWHGCPLCYKAPKTRADFWKSKVDRNMQRDTRYEKLLKKEGYEIIKIWEHELKANRAETLIRVKEEIFSRHAR